MLWGGDELDSNCVHVGVCVFEVFRRVDNVFWVIVMLRDEASLINLDVLTEKKGFF